jgi:16S rRNA processing protein RimM
VTDLVAVGRVGRPHGLGGAFVVDDASEEPDRFAPGARLYVDGQAVEVVDSKRAGGRIVVALDHEVPRGAVLTLPRAELPPAEEGAYYVADLVGLEVLEESGRPLGRVREVLPGVANDVLALDTGAALPMVEECVLHVDLAAGRVLVAQGFAD